MVKACFVEVRQHDKRGALHGLPLCRSSYVPDIDIVRIMEVGSPWDREGREGRVKPAIRPFSAKASG